MVRRAQRAETKTRELQVVDFEFEEQLPNGENWNVAILEKVVLEDVDEIAIGVARRAGGSRGSECG